MFPIPKSILDAAAMAHSAAFNAEIKEAADAPEAEWGSMTDAIKNVMKMAAESVKMGPKPELTTPWPDAIEDISHAFKVQPPDVKVSYSTLMANMISSVAESFKIPTMEESRRSVRRAEIRRDIRRMEAKYSYDLAMANLPEWVEEPHSLAQSLTLLWLDFAESIHLFDDIVEANLNEEEGGT